VLYGCILGAIFVVIPFTYFFYEEFGENVSFCRRVFAGCKYTIFLVLAAVIILIIGLFVQGGSPSTEDKDYKKYVEKIIDTENRTSLRALGGVCSRSGLARPEATMIVMVVMMKQAN
jgi:LMBR1 domain-containing protein 1